MTSQSSGISHPVLCDSNNFSHSEQLSSQFSVCVYERMLVQAVSPRPCSVLQSLVSLYSWIFFILVSWDDIHSISNLGVSGLIFSILHSTKQDFPLPLQRGAQPLYCRVCWAGSAVLYSTTNKLPRMAFAQHSTPFYRVMQSCKISHISQIPERCITLILQFAMKNCQCIFPDLVIPLKIGFSLST